MVMKDRAISQAVVRRLPRYLHQLDELLAQGGKRVSSQQLAELLSFTASQIRQDLNCFGGFGQQGYGYDIQNLRDKIADIIGLNLGKTAIIIGAGHLGQALCRNFDFKQSGFTLLAAFDLNVDDRMSDCLPLLHVDELAEFTVRYKPDLAVLTLSREATQEMAARLTELGIKGFWNFTGIQIDAPCVENVNFSDSLKILCYYLKEST